MLMEFYVNSLFAFYELNMKRSLPPSAQLIFLLLLHLDYCSGCCGEFRVTDRELGLRTGMAKKTITEAKRTLKNRGFIDFKTDKEKPQKGTIYKILTGRDFERDVGQEEGRIVDEKSLLSARTSVPTASDVSAVAAKRKLPPVPPFKEKNQSVYLSIPQAGGGGVSSKEEEPERLPEFFGKEIHILSKEEQLEHLVDFWEKEIRGGRLSIEHQSRILFHLGNKSEEWLKEVMKEASDANSNPHGLQPKFFFACLEKKLESEKTQVDDKLQQKKNYANENDSQIALSLKGSLKNENQDRRKNYGHQLKPPTRSGNEPWANRGGEGGNGAV